MCLYIIEIYVLKLVRKTSGTRNCSKRNSEKSHIRTNARRLRTTRIMSPAVRLRHLYVTSGMEIRVFRPLDFCCTECTSFYLPEESHLSCLNFVHFFVSGPMFRYQTTILARPLFVQFSSGSSSGFIP
jgi:hypothetical protein